MTRIQNNTGRVMDDLKPPPLPPSLEYLWITYLEIRKGAALVGYAELKNYQEITGVILSPWESSLMLEIDLMRNHND